MKNRVNAGSHIISESFSYALNINNPVLAIYLRNIYAPDLADDTESIIDSVLYYVNEFSESNGAIQYRCKIKNFDQYLHIIDLMLNFFSYQQARYFVELAQKLFQDR
jgi:hypothetical protein